MNSITFRRHNMLDVVESRVCINETSSYKFRELCRFQSIKHLVLSKNFEQSSQKFLYNQAAKKYSFKLRCFIISEDRNISTNEFKLHIINFHFILLLDSIIYR